MTLRPLFALVAAATAAAASSAHTLTRDIEAVLGTKAFDGCTFGVSATASGRPLYDRNADTFFTPMSNGTRCGGGLPSTTTSPPPRLWL